MSFLGFPLVFVYFLRGVGKKKKRVRKKKKEKKGRGGGVKDHVFLFLYSMEVNIGRETNVGIVCGYLWSCDLMVEVTPFPCGFKVTRFQGFPWVQGQVIHIYIYKALDMFLKVHHVTKVCLTS